jgi:anti-sigma factor RsiW
MKSAVHGRCRDLLMRLSMYVGGDLAARERRSVIRHIDRCPCCDAFASSLRKTVVICRQAGRQRLPAQVRARARARIKRLMSEG